MKKGFDYIGISVVNMCHDGNGNYLISKRGPGCRDEHGTWEPAGSGGVEHTESLEEAIRREVKEECGAMVKHFEFMGFREVLRNIDGKTVHWIAFDFKTEIDPNEVKIMEPDKCTDFQWCTVEEIPHPQHSQFPYFLEKYKDKLL
jgi:8-oxo-dGTP diphosphatase